MKKLILGLLAALLLFTSCQNNPYEDELKKVKEENSKNTSLIEELKEDLEAEKNKSVAASYAELFAKRTGFVLDQTYSSDWDYFRIDSDGTVSYWGMSGAEITPTDTVGTIVDLRVPTGYSGLIAVVETTAHTNYGQYCYPDYAEEATGTSEWGTPIYTHSGCFVGFYCKPNGNGLSMAQSSWNVPGHSYTACAETLNDFYKLYDEYGYDATCASQSSQYAR